MYLCVWSLCPGCTCLEQKPACVWVTMCVLGQGTCKRYSEHYYIHQLKCIKKKKRVTNVYTIENLYKRIWQHPSKFGLRYLSSKVHNVHFSKLQQFCIAATKNNALIVKASMNEILFPIPSMRVWKILKLFRAKFYTMKIPLAPYQMGAQSGWPNKCSELTTAHAGERLYVSKHYFWNWTLKYQQLEICSKIAVLFRSSPNVKIALNQLSPQNQSCFSFKMRAKRIYNVERSILKKLHAHQ